MLLPNLDEEPKTGDLERVAVRNGDDDDAKASNPERFAGVVEDVDVSGTRGDGGVDVPRGVWGLGDEGLDEANMFWPFTDAKGELVEA